MSTPQTLLIVVLWSFVTGWCAYRALEFALRRELDAACLFLLTVVLLFVAVQRTLEHDEGTVAPPATERNGNSLPGKTLTGGDQ